LGREDFKTYYLNYYSTLCYFAQTIVGSAEAAEDVVEDVFLKLYQSKKTFSPDDNVTSYLYTATRNESLTHLKRNNSTMERQWHYNSEISGVEQAHIKAMIQSEVLRSVLDELNNLPGRCGEVIRLSYFEGLKNLEIAELLGISEQTVKNLKSKGLTLLKTKLSPETFLLFCMVCCNFKLMS
jgi:RNA polymerase sigma-70 factor (family 1)